MECPFCAETIKDEAVACKNCSRDLRVVRPILLEIEEIVADLDKLRRDLDRAGARLERTKYPLRYFSTLTLLYVIVPTILLVAAQVAVTIVFNVSPIHLLLACLILPLPFGFATYPIHKIGFLGALVLGIATAAVSVLGMLTVTGIHDGVAILPATGRDWLEDFQFSSCIALALVTGNIIGTLLFQVLPRMLAQGGKPNAAAFRMARLLGQHVGEEQLRRRARLIQNLMQAAGPVAGIAATAIGSIYAGLKGIMGS